MAVVEVHPEAIDGPWIEGFVFDRHVISSRPIGYSGEHMQFETTRSVFGELVYQLKYRNGPLNDIVETAVAFINDRWNGVIDCVVPPPPSLFSARGTPSGPTRIRYGSRGEVPVIVIATCCPALAENE